MGAAFQTIPANDIVAVTPGVLAAGGSAIDIVALMLTTSTRVPTGTTVSFPSEAEVADYFGPGTPEDLASAIYFNGFDNSNVKPGSVLFAQYNQTAVPAYLRGGNISALTLAQLQALTGLLTIDIDGYNRSATVNLSGATSFSSAAGLIQTAENNALADAPSFTGVIAGNTLTASAVTGTIAVGQIIAGSGVTAGTVITAYGSGVGGAGTYTVSPSQTVSSTAMTGSYNQAAFTASIGTTVLTVTAVASGVIAVGQEVVGAGVAANTVITALGTGTGGTGTYTVNNSQTVASESMTTQPVPVVVSYDSVSGAFIITSGITGVASEAAFASAPLATSLLLTSVTGATLSQGAAAVASPGAFMDAVVLLNQDFATLMTVFNPDVSGNTNKLAFAAWVNNQNNRYMYVPWDPDLSPTTQNPAASSLGYLVNFVYNYAGTAVVFSPDYSKAAFICGIAASINFTQTNGRVVFKFRTQTGLVPDVNNLLERTNLAANGYNFYGVWATATQQFIGIGDGTVSGPFRWIDSYINQIWLNAQFQLDLMDLLFQVFSIPYNAAGDTLIEASLIDTIQQAGAFGAYRSGIQLSSLQAAEVNGAAGAVIAPTLQNQGWYLQVKASTTAPSVRAARGSPPCTFWYTDGQSVQKINLASINVQ